MSKTRHSLLMLLVLCLLPVAAGAQSNAEPSLHTALAPCQVFSGDLPANVTVSIDVRGVCNVPEEATAVVLVTHVAAAGSGTLKDLGVRRRPAVGELHELLRRDAELARRRPTLRARWRVLQGRLGARDLCRDADPGRVGVLRPARRVGASPCAAREPALLALGRPLLRVLCVVIGEASSAEVGIVDVPERGDNYGRVVGVAPNDEKPVPSVVHYEERLVQQGDIFTIFDEPRHRVLRSHDRSGPLSASPS